MTVLLTFSPAESCHDILRFQSEAFSSILITKSQLAQERYVRFSFEETQFHAPERIAYRSLRAMPECKKGTSIGEASRRPHVSRESFRKARERKRERETERRRVFTRTSDYLGRGSSRFSRAAHRIAPRRSEEWSPTAIP